MFGSAIAPLRLRPRFLDVIVAQRHFIIGFLCFANLAIAVDPQPYFSIQNNKNVSWGGDTRDIFSRPVIKLSPESHKEMGHLMNGHKNKLYVRKVLNSLTRPFGISFYDISFKEKRGWLFRFPRQYSLKPFLSAFYKKVTFVVDSANRVNRKLFNYIRSTLRA